MIRGPWTESAFCHNGGHCGPCRHLRSFRETLVRDGWEVDGVDFTCPFGESPPDPMDGPGTRLARLLKKMGFVANQTCGCHAMTLAMNAWGETCEEHMDEILASMRRASADPRSNPLRIPFSEYFARALVIRCLRGRCSS